jgi:hypothetical protein
VNDVATVSSTVSLYLLTYAIIYYIDKALWICYSC